MNKPPAVVFDSDEILLDWVTGFVNWHNKTYGTNVDPATEYFNKLHNLFPEIDYDVIDDRMKFYNANTWEFGTIPAVAGAVTTMRHIVRLNEQREVPIIFKVITKSGNEGAALRRANLANVFGDIFHNVFCLNLKESKVPYMDLIQAKYDVKLFVDDYFKNCEEITAECGVRSMALRCNHNKHLESSGFEVADGWLDIRLALEEIVAE